MAVDKAGCQISFPERLCIGQGMQEANVGFHTCNPVMLKCLNHAVDGLITGFVPYNQFGNHRVVVNADFIAFDHAGIYANMGAFIRRAQVTQIAGGGQEVLIRVFGINAGFQSMATDFYLGLLQRQGFTPGDFQLPFHQILAGNHFGNRVLDLQAGVHFHKEERTVDIVEKLNGAGAHIVDGLGRFDSSITHGLTGFFAQPGCRGFFQNFLVTALNRAVTLGQIHAVAALVAEHLDFNVARLGQVAFYQHVRVAEGVLGFALGGSECIIKFADVLNHAHAFTTATRYCFQQ